MLAQSRFPTNEPLGLRMEIVHLPDGKLALLVVRVRLCPEFALKVKVPFCPGVVNVAVMGVPAGSTVPDKSVTVYSDMVAEPVCVLVGLTKRK